MSKSIQAAWIRETLMVENAIVTETRTTMEEVGMRLKFEDNAIQLDGERIEKEWKPTCIVSSYNFLLQGVHFYLQ